MLFFSKNTFSNEALPEGACPSTFPNGSTFFWRVQTIAYLFARLVHTPSIFPFKLDLETACFIPFKGESMEWLKSFRPETPPLSLQEGWKKRKAPISKWWCSAASPCKSLLYLGTFPVSSGKTQIAYAKRRIYGIFKETLRYESLDSQKRLPSTVKCPSLFLLGLFQGPKFTLTILTPQELNATSDPAHGSGDELRHTAPHERSKGYQKEKAAAQPDDHGADPPLHAWNVLEGSVASTLLHHHHHLETLVSDWIGTPPESAKGYGFLQLRAKQPVRHEEAHTGDASAEEGKKCPNHACASQARGHVSSHSCPQWQRQEICELRQGALAPARTLKSKEVFAESHHVQDGYPSD